MSDSSSRNPNQTSVLAGAPSKGLSLGFARFVIRWRNGLLLFAALLFCAAKFLAPSIEFDRSIESMFRPDDPQRMDFERLKATFGGSEVVLIVYEDPELLASDGRGLQRLARLGDQFKEVDGIDEVFSLAELDRILGGQRRNQEGAPFSGITNPESGSAARLLDLFAGYTHSRDGTVAAIVCLIDGNRGKPAHLRHRKNDEPETTSPDRSSSTDRGESNLIDQRDQIVLHIHTMINRIQKSDPSTPKLMLIGEPVMIADSFRMVEADGERLGWTSSILLMLVIFVLFRSIRWMLIPVVVVQAAITWTQAIVALSGLQLTMVSSMMNAIIAVIGVASSVHVIVRFRVARRLGLNREAALEQSIAMLAAPISWAIATDIAGFAALAFSDLKPVQDFALMMSISSAMVLIGIFLSVPGLALITLPHGLRWLDNDPTSLEGRGLLNEQLDQSLAWTEKYAKSIVIGAFLVTGVLSLGLINSRVESDFTKNFRSDHEITQAYSFVEERLGGAGVWDVVIPAPVSLNWDYLEKVKRLQTRLEREVQLTTDNGERVRGLSKVISLADAIRTVPVDLETIPFGRDPVVSATVLTMRTFLPKYCDAMLSTDTNVPDQRYLRIMLRSQERLTSEQKTDLIRQVSKICAEEFETQDDKPAFFITGYFVLMANMIESIIRDQWVTFAAALLGIALMMLIAFRSFKLALIGLVPNVLCMLMMLGCMGWLGIKVNLGIALIASVAMGMSVDSSIHYIVFFQRARIHGDRFGIAIAHVQDRVGRALVASTLAIVCGFFTLCFSPFIPVVYFGVLSIVAMLAGLLGNLIILPALLFLFASGSNSSAQ
jgi:uncharacterized protein